MGLFSSPKVPSTISDRQMASLRRRADRQQRREGGMFSRRAVNQRLASNRQHEQSRWN